MKRKTKEKPKHWDEEWNWGGEGYGNSLCGGFSDKLRFTEWGINDVTCKNCRKKLRLPNDHKTK